MSGLLACSIIPECGLRLLSSVHRQQKEVSKISGKMTPSFLGFTGSAHGIHSPTNSASFSNLPSLRRARMGKTRTHREHHARKVRTHLRLRLSVELRSFQILSCDNAHIFGEGVAKKANVS